MLLHPALWFGLLGVWSRGRGRVAARSPLVPADAPIEWIGGAVADEDARVVEDALAHRRIARYAEVIEHVAEQLFRRDLTRIGVALDIGFLRGFYRAYARELLRELDGALVRIGRQS